MENNSIDKVTWCKIYTFLQTVDHVYITQEAKAKSFIEAVYWIARSGTNWRFLPREYGKWNTVYKRFIAWRDKDIWNKLHQFFIQDPDLEWVSIDSTIVRAHASAAGYKKNQQDKEALGRSRGGFSTKIHALVDALGNPLKFMITPGQRHDITVAQQLIENVHNCTVIADKGYDANWFRELLSSKNCLTVIPSRANRKKPYDYDKDLYKERHAIECLFSKIKHYRRVFSRFDKSLKSFTSFVAIVGALIWLR